MCAIVFYNAWKVYFVILSIQYFHNALGGITCTCWLLGKARIKLKQPGNARFGKLLIFLMGRRISSIVMVIYLKSNTAPLLAND
jgi:hypothetical protein